MADTEPYEWICPNFSPYTLSEFKATWVTIQAKEILYQTAFMDNEDGGLILGREGNRWKFLAPEQIMETINNSWEPWETVSSRLAGKGKEFVQLGNEGTSIKNAFENSDWGTNIKEAFKALSSVKKTNMKIDTPLVYESTERREFTMQFNLVGNDNKTTKEMLGCVMDLKDASMPAKDTTDGYGLGILLPYAFKIRTEPGPLLYTNDYCAITSVQPTYMAPYTDEGYPMKIELTITFKELSPLYRIEEILEDD